MNTAASTAQIPIIASMITILLSRSAKAYWLPGEPWDSLFGNDPRQAILSAG